MKYARPALLTSFICLWAFLNTPEVGCIDFSADMYVKQFQADFETKKGALCLKPLSRRQSPPNDGTQSKM